MTPPPDSAPSTADGPARQRAIGNVPAAVVVGGGLFAADLAAGTSENFAGLFLVMPLIASTAGPVAHTVQMAVLAVVLAVASFVIDDVSATEVQVRGVGVLLGSGLAIVLARSRQEREDHLADLSGFARLAQELILRPAPPRLGVVRAAARYRAASDVLTVGGDLYDVALTPFGVRFIVGDAKGKGLEAVRVAAAVLAHFRETVFTEGDLAQLSAALDARVAAASTAAGGEPDFVTAVIGQLANDGVLTFVSCGHVDGVHLPRGAEPGAMVRMLESAHRALPLGLGSEAVAEQVQVGAGDRLVFFTDGVSEARDRERAYFDVAAHTACMLDEATLDGAVDHLLDRLVDHTGGHLHDDVAILGLELELERTGATPAGSSAGAATSS